MNADTARSQSRRPPWRRTFQDILLLRHRTAHKITICRKAVARNASGKSDAARPCPVHRGLGGPDALVRPARSTLDYAGQLRFVCRGERATVNLLDETRLLLQPLDRRDLVEPRSTGQPRSTVST